MEYQILLNIVERVKKSGNKETITPRELLSAFGLERRTRNNCWRIDEFLKEHEIEVVPNYNDVWIDTSITLQRKQVAMRKNSDVPIKQLQVLEAANKKPIMVDKNDTLDTAITCMQLHNYSQLPVLSGGPRSLCGYISWQTIGIARANGICSNVVKDYMKKDYRSMSLTDSLLYAVYEVFVRDFVVVLNESKEVCGIITTSDISKQYLSWTKPFVLLEEIENHLRVLLEGKFLLEKVRQICKDKDREVNSIDDLTFGEYLRLIENEGDWSRLQLKSVDRKTFFAYIR